MTDDNERVFNLGTAAIAGICVIAGTVLCALSMPQYGVPLLTAAVGAAFTKPLIRGDN